MPVAACPRNERRRQGWYIYKPFLSVVSGETTLSEQQGLGDHEFVPWQIGAVM